MLGVAVSRMMYRKVHGITRQPERIRRWKLAQTLLLPNTISVWLDTNAEAILSDVAVLNYERCLGERVTKD